MVTRRRLLLIAFAGPLCAQSVDRRIATLEKMSAAQPGNARLRVQLALDYLQKLRETGEGRYLELANKAVDSVLARDANHLDALRARNEINLHLHLFRRVAQDAERIVKAAPSDPGGWSNLGDASMELGQYDRAGDAYRRMAALRPDLTSHNRIGWHAFVTGNAAGAIRAMKAAIAAGSELPEQVAWCWNELGDIQFKTGDRASARSSYERALGLFPSLHSAHAGMGRLLAEAGKPVEAIASLQKAKSIRPQPQYCAELEALYAARKMTREAAAERQVLDALAKLAAARGETADRTLAIIYADQNRNLGEALSLAKAEFENRDDVYSYDALSWVLHKMGRNPEARAASAKAMRYRTPEPSFRRHAEAIAKAG